jgi:8-oxo-dGTP diphosphatase
MKTPEFGEPGRAPVTERPAAYALLRDEKGIAAVRAAGGHLFLPGGGVRPGETPEGAVVRESMEECRMTVECVRRFSEAIQHFTARGDGVRYRSPMSFIECRCLGKEEGDGEHEFVWLEEDPGPDAFAHDAHRWAFDEFRAARLRLSGPGTP